MKEYKVKITDEALSDMNQIYDYINETLLSPENAISQYNRIADGILKLSSFPKRFHTLDFEPWRTKGLRRMIVDNYANEDLIENMAVFFFYIVYFDKVTPYKNLDKIINNITTLRKKILNKENEDFRQNLFDLVQDDSKEKEQLLSTFESNEFFLKISNYENTSNVYRVNLKYNIEFPEIYSTIAIEKAFNMTTVSEDKLFVEYYMISVKILNDILKGNFKKQYILEFSDTLLKKKQKMNRLMKIINNLAIQDKISLKIRYEQFNKNKEQIYELMRNGFKIAVILDSTVNTERTEIERLNIFSYILINKDASYYDDIMKNKKILRNIIEI